MHIIAKCPRCDAGLPVAAAEAPSAITCGGCARPIPLAITPALRDDAEVDACPVCRGAEFWLRKDFDPKLGLTVVIIGGLISAGFFWYGMDVVAYGVLVVAVLLDVVVYGRLGDITVCYRCHSEFRGRYRRTAKAFDLETADDLEREYRRRIGRQ